MVRPPIPERAPEAVEFVPGKCRTCNCWERNGDNLWRFCRQKKGRTWWWETCDSYQD